MSTLKLTPLAVPDSLKSQAYRALRTAIVDAEIYSESADLRLDERALSERFGISRTPIREAIAQLEHEGLVHVVPRRGVFVVRKTKTEILEMITVWAALEGMAARLATASATDEQIARLFDLVDAFAVDAVAQRMGEYSDANIQFHQAIIALGGCKLIGQMTDDLFVHVKAIRRRTIFERDRARRSVVDHRHIIEALVARDAGLAERLVRDHTLRLRDHVAEHVDLDFALNARDGGSAKAMAGRTAGA